MLPVELAKRLATLLPYVTLGKATIHLQIGLQHRADLHRERNQLWQEFYYVETEGINNVLDGLHHFATSVISM